MAHFFSSEPTRVVVVEDDSVTRKALCLSITASPALQLIAEFDCATPALTWLESGSLDVLLTDLALPDGHGIEIIHQCSRLHPRCDIMVLTTSSSECDVLACIEAGASGYLLKGSSKDDIANAVLNMRQGGAPMSPVIARMVLDRMRNGRPRTAVTTDDADGPALTKKEKAILDLIARGETYGDIAGMLTVSVGTVQTHIKSIYGKLSVHSRSEAVFEAQRKGLIEPGSGTLN
ncbi:MAG: response regulator transcription factor [Burkholderiales bacterium]|nr:response regulator transcription factor [Burkholderiales bacterium]